MIVDWPWLALPASVVVTTFAYFAAILRIRRRLERDVASWDSSPLPLFLCRSDSTGSTTGDLQDLDGIKSCAKQLVVELIVGPDGMSRLKVKQMTTVPSE